MKQQGITIETQEETKENYELVTSNNPEHSLTQGEGPEYDDNGLIKYAMVQEQDTGEIKEIYLQDQNETQAKYRVGIFGKDVLNKGRKEKVEADTAQSLKELTDQVL